jgi:FkbM family methyltransferase
MSIKRLIERPLFYWPALHAAIIVRRSHPDLNKLAWILLIKRGDTVFDIGANRGIYTEFFSRKVGQRGRVYAFEPVPESAQSLRSRCSQLENVQIIQAAVSDTNGRCQIYIPGPDFAQASLALQTAKSWKQFAEIGTREIETITLDDWVGENPVGRVSFLKIDVEGAEYKVLRGAAKTLLRDTPLLFMEVSRAWLKGFGVALSELDNQLTVLGYRYSYRPQILKEKLNFERISLSDHEDGDILFSTTPLHLP